MSRKVQFELNDLLSLLLCSEFYEFHHDILYHTIAEKMVSLTDEEIEKFLEENSKDEEGVDYTTEEIENMRQYFYSVRDEYINISEE
jgi:hypothetical protein